MAVKYCECCREELEHEYCYVCDGGEDKSDQIHVDRDYIRQLFHTDEHDQLITTYN